jgi:hypothetical protein
VLNVVSEYAFMEMADMCIMCGCAYVDDAVVCLYKDTFLTCEIPGMELGMRVLFHLAMLSVAKII